ncbi:ATP-binding protein [Kitasatospora sp. NBC_01287]|uniref:ATP-binding protein n=1 Tax=Kitasatospora sp. NBC_01287 TaxID=2903573 RepID=UPI00225C10C5|nr:ATP-binding protein [Kitasatospora sp. NBC_01287]MCX4744633.1 ATP-binding protein [Kitasatospora sp. NBC_01287]
MGETSIRATGWARSFPVSGGVRAGRQWAREHLDALGWASAAPDTVDDVLLTVSELITNAHVHAHSSAQLVLLRDRRHLHVYVHDSSSALPRPKPPDAGRPDGRGLAIIDALADSWRTRPQADGKTIAACFLAPEQPEAEARTNG